MDRFLPRLISCFIVLCIASDALASGFRPFAQPDSLTVYQGGTATVLDSGATSVLDNDWDWERDTLTASLDKAPKHGTLVLNPDGTFKYVHDGGGSNDDEFRYKAFDGTRWSRSAKVTIRIEKVPNEPPRVTGAVDDQEAFEGVRFRLELAGYFTDPDPDDTLTFGAEGLPGSLSIDPVTGLMSGTPQRGDASNKPYDVEVTATDRAGASAKLRFDLFIREDSRTDLALDARVVTNPIRVGETSRWNIVIDNNGPGRLDTAAVTADWTTAGASLALTAPANCSVSDNNTPAPRLTCNITGLAAGEAATVSVQGLQGGPGDNSVIGRVVADDPRPGNNTDLASAQVVAEFGDGPAQAIDFSGIGIDAGDVNGDGEIDVVATGPQSVVYFNNGDRALSTPGTSLGDSSGATSIALLDWNGDAQLDIAVGGQANRTAEIFVNDGTGSFASTARIQRNVGSVSDVAGADLDGDGRSELVIAGTSGIVIARNDGQDGADVTTLTATGTRGLVAADIDRDGDRDLITVRTSDRAIRLYYNDGSGAGFSHGDLQFGSVGAVNVADINGDGAPDLLLGLDGDDLQPPRHRVAYQQGNGQFAADQQFGASPANVLLAGDIDDDGWIDVVVVNEAGVHQVYRGSSQGGLSLAPEQLVSDGMQRGVLVDLNGDESLDLVLVGPGSAGLEIHANNGIGRLGRGDRVAPELRLLGEATISIPAGAEYVESGATAVDDIDGDITDRVEISGTVNTTVVGTQTLTYRVSDRAGNTASVVRTINVGVNQGTGGAGGGALSPALLLLFGLLALCRRAGEKAKIL